MINGHENLRLGEWKNGVAFVYRKGLRKDDSGDVIIGAWETDRYYTLMEIFQSTYLHERYHEEVKRNGCPEGT